MHGVEFVLEADKWDAYSLREPDQMKLGPDLYTPGFAFKELISFII